jgi:hypothetical protein
MLELAPLYALDALAGPDLEAFERELEANPALRAEVDELREISGSLGVVVESVEPPPELRRRLMAKAMPQKPEVLLDEDGLLILRSEAAGWRPHPMPGLSFKPLYVDRSTGRSTALVRFKAGSVLPAHRHAAVEELFVLEGNVEVNGIPMGPGDYCRADASSTHQPARAVTDAVILVRNSLRDEYR